MKPLLLIGLFVVSTTALATPMASVFMPIVDPQLDSLSPSALNPIFIKDKNGWHGFVAETLYKSVYGTAEWNFKGGKADAAKEFSWTIFFDGKTLGTLKSRWKKKIENATSYQAQDVLSVKKTANFPKRPLLISSFSTVNDPQQWKASKDFASLEAAAKKEFIRLYPSKYKCLTEPHGDPAGSKKLEEKLSILDLEAFKAYRSNNGMGIIGIRKKESCFEDVQSANNHWLPNWFVISKEGKARLLNVAGEPLEAADLDQDGISEWLFMNLNYANLPTFHLYTNGLTKDVECCGPL